MKQRRIIPLVNASPAPGGGCKSSSCGGADRGNMPEAVWQKVKDHPCYSEEAHHHFARMHVAVAPACNIQCNYCNRKYDCANESRPGVVSEKLTPELAARKVLAVAARLPQLSVVGIAGPGDALANPEKTFRTFGLIAEKMPDLRLCLSTNGLALPEHVDAIAALNVDHVTITINAFDPEIGARIYPWIFFEHRRRRGVEAARILAERQLAGLEQLVAAGILVKVNSVLIPGINDEHLREVNRIVKEMGAFLHNIMPLISDPAHGTHFGLSGQRGPEPAELEALQDACANGTKLMKHCRQCRADAVGLLGEDIGAEFAADRLPEAPQVNHAAREAYRQVVEAERAQRDEAARRAREALAGAERPTRRVAVATKGNERINEHFGHAREFLVFELSGDHARFIGHRKIEQYCQGGWGEDDILPGVIRAIADCKAVFVAKVGLCPARELAAAGITPVQDYAFEYIEPSLLDWYRKVDLAAPMAACA